MAAWRLMSLGEALLAADTLSWRSRLCIDRAKPLELGTVCGIAEPHDADGTIGIPGLESSYDLGVHQLQDVVANAREQLTNPGAKELLEALQHYLENDAFIVFAT